MPENNVSKVTENSCRVCLQKYGPGPLIKWGCGCCCLLIANIAAYKLSNRKLGKGYNQTVLELGLTAEEWKERKYTRNSKMAEWIVKILEASHEKLMHVASLES